MTRFHTIFLVIVVIFLLGGSVIADRLPNGSSTNNFHVPSQASIESVGMLSTHTEAQMYTANYPLNQTGFLAYGEKNSVSTYDHDLLSNGGYLKQARDQVFDEGAQTGGYNINSHIISTYASDPEKGSAMVSSENLQVETSGNVSLSNVTIKSSLVKSIIQEYVGGFNGDYKSDSDVRMTTGQLQTVAQARSVGADEEVPASTRYSLSIHPDLSSGLPYAEGSASTSLVASTEDGDSNMTGFNNTTSAFQKTVTLSDSTTVDGLIFTFQKAYATDSGIKI